MKPLPKPIKSYTEVTEHEGKKLEITLNIYDEPIFDKGNSVHTHVSITHHGKPWGHLFLPAKVADKNLERTINDIKENLNELKIQAGNHELN